MTILVLLSQKDGQSADSPDEKRCTRYILYYCLLGDKRGKKLFSLQWNCV